MPLTPAPREEPRPGLSVHSLRTIPPLLSLCEVHTFSTRAPSQTKGQGQGVSPYGTCLHISRPLAGGPERTSESDPLLGHSVKFFALERQGKDPTNLILSATNVSPRTAAPDPAQVPVPEQCAKGSQLGIQRHCIHSPSPHHPLPPSPGYQDNPVPSS